MDINSTGDHVLEKTEFPHCISEESSKLSKNSIFDLDHRISKPVELMTTEEVQAFRETFLQPNIIPKATNVRVPPKVELPKLKKESLPFFDKTAYYESKLTPKNFLGEGLYSKVYLENQYAIKKLKPFNEAQRSGLIESFLLFRLKHSSIVRLICTKDQSDINYDVLTLKSISEIQSINIPKSLNIELVLEYCSNGNLWNWIQANPFEMGMALFLKWMLGITQGVEAMAKMGIINHDLKPHNILVKLILIQLTNLLDIKICDFGNALVVPEAKSYFEKMEPFILIPGSEAYIGSQKLNDGIGRSTPSYTAPELFTIDQNYSFEVDVYSVGVILYVLISRNEPFPYCRNTVQIIQRSREGFFKNRSQVIDPFNGCWKFHNNEDVPHEIINLLCDLLQITASNRPTIIEVVKKVKSIIQLYT